MAGTQFKIDVTIRDTSFPILSKDSVLPAKGAMMLLDLTHPVEQMKSGVPTEGQLLPNIAWEQAAALFGAGTTKGQTEADWHQQGSGNPVTPPDVLRTSKGGIYFKRAYAGGWHPEKLLNYMISKPSNDFYVSLWGYAELAATQYVSRLMGNPAGTPTSGAAYELDRTGNRQLPTQTGTTAPTSGIGSYRVARAYSGNTLGGTGALLRSGFTAGMFGTYGGLSDTGNRVYRFYMEDLTASGRSFATVSALDEAAYTKEVLTEGGRYYGDTVSLPA